MEIEKHVFGKQMFTGSCRDNGTQSGLSSLGLPGTPTTPSPIFFEDISGDCSILATGPLSKVFKQLRGK